VTSLCCGWFEDSHSPHGCGYKQMKRTSIVHLSLQACSVAEIHWWFGTNGRRSGHRWRWGELSASARESGDWTYGMFSHTPQGHLIVNIHLPCSTHTNLSLKYVCISNCWFQCVKTPLHSLVLSLVLDGPFLIQSPTTYIREGPRRLHFTSHDMDREKIHTANSASYPWTHTVHIDTSSRSWMHADLTQEALFTCMQQLLLSEMLLGPNVLVIC